MADFIPCFEKTLALEGGYKLHTVKGDRGGMTYAGISRVHHPNWPGWKLIDADNMANLTGLVRVFYKERYWDKVKGDEITSQQVAFTLYDFAVNAGVKTSVKIAQKIVGSSPDGRFGPVTLKTVNGLVKDDKDEQIFLLLFSQLKIYRYKNIVMADKRRGNDQVNSNLRFLCGWINRVERSLDYV